jgi:hypothetical protein
MAARVIAEIPGAVGRYLFSHALIRETLYEELSTTRRVRLHRQIAEALEALYRADPEPHLAELAHHYFEGAQGGDPDKAIAYAVRAGDRAAGLLAYEEAARHYETALQAMELKEPSAAPARCDLLLKLTGMLWSAGDPERAREMALRVADLARTIGSFDHLGRAALSYSGRFVAFDSVNRDDALVGLLEEALQALPETDSALRSGVLGRLAEEITFSDPIERRQALARKAVEVARRVGDPAVLATALLALHWSTWMADNLEERLALATEIMQLADRAGDRLTLLEGHVLRFWDLAEVGDLAGMKRESEICARLVDELRQPYGRWLLAHLRVLLAFMEGRLKDAEALAQQAFEMGRRRMANAASRSAPPRLLRTEQGRFEEAMALTTRASRCSRTSGIN